MYFSRVRIETGALAQIELMKLLQGDIYAAHQLIWKLFPNDPDAKRTFLFRQEFEKEQISFTDTRHGMPIFYLVSEVKPAPVNGLLKVDLKEYNPIIKNGASFTFELRVNPVVQEKIKRNNTDEWAKNRREKGLREKAETKLRRYHDVLMDEKRRAKADGITDKEMIQKRMDVAIRTWFILKEKDCGFTLENDRMEATSYRQQLLRKRGSREISFSSVDLSGVLTVTDIEKFKNTLFNGLGRSKAFGCGLLLIKPVR
jgi:CRISPR system Cascade subunit CasE